MEGQLTIQYSQLLKEQKTVEKSALAYNFFPKYVFTISAIINIIHNISRGTASWLALKMLSVVLRRKLKPQEEQFYKEGKKSVHRVGHRSFNTYTYGSPGPAVLMLHGYCSNGARWQPNVDSLLQRGFQIIVMDAPGHGTSKGMFLSVPFYIECVKSVLQSRKDWHAVVTHSIGGLAGAVALAEIKWKPMKPRFVIMNSFATGDSLMTKFARLLGLNAAVIEGAKAFLSHQYGRELDSISVVNSFDPSKFNGLLIYDTDDRVVPQAESLLIANSFPHLSVLRTSGLGHNLRGTHIINRVATYLTAY